jgi:Gpi18-like mannosyltransferase
MLLLGFFQYFYGALGINAFKEMGSAVMKDKVLRYWAVEHIAGMLVSIVLITLGYGVRKKAFSDFLKHRRALILYSIALLLILASMPWPWREGVARPWFPGM